MSYQVLARKWRPATFEQMVGQSHVLHALTNALSQQRLHHAYLFTGTRGVGKTSLARLFAKGLNCEQGVTASPCGVCDSCVEIAQGRFVDLIEVDAASRTKVDDTRELLDNVQYRPTRGRFKVYLIDEVHMLSRSSFNALLKTLEEPPEHVKFLLATTDPQKLPVTVLSRCLQFNLKSLTQQEIGTQLEYILTQEQLPFDIEALTLLAKAANGSMRDALSLTDQAIAFGSGHVMLTQVQTMLGSIDEQHVVALLKALTDADIGVLMHTCTQILAYGADAQEVLRSLLELLHQITLTQFAPAAAQQSLYSAQISAFAEQLAPEQVQLYYQILLTGRKDLPYAPDPKSGLEMALLRAVTFVPEKSVKRWQVDAPAEVSLPLGQTSISREVSVPVAEKKTEVTIVAPLAPQTEHDTDEELFDGAIDTALVAEQTLIISQAQSLGGHSQIERSDIPKALSTQYSTTSGLNTYSAETAIEYDHYAQEPMSQGAQQDDDASFLYDDGSEQVQDVIAIEGGDLVKTDDPFVSTESLHPTASLVNDDILSAVLAARESLLSDLDALSTKDGDEKKSSLDHKLKVQPVGSSATTGASDRAQSALSDLQSPLKTLCSEFEIDFDDEFEVNASEELNSTIQAVMPNKTVPVTQHVSPKTPLDSNDRPPWEEAPLTAIHQGKTQQFQQHPQQVSDVSTTPVQAPDIEASVSDSCEAEISGAESISGHPLDLHWYKLMASLDVGGRVRQLAVNSVCQVFADPLPLLLKPDQKHLAADVAIEQLEQALATTIGNPWRVQVVIGSDPQRETPLELRKRFHQELLQQAQQSLLKDNNVQWLIERLGADLDADTLVYPPELLNQRSQQIQALPEHTVDHLIK